MPQHRFKAGESGNPKGRPKGSYTTTNQVRTEFLKALQRIEKQEHKKLFDHFIKQAFADNRVLTDVMHKIMPDISSIKQEISGNDGIRLIIEYSDGQKDKTASGPS